MHGFVTGCEAADNIVQNARRQVGAPPFIGLIPLGSDKTKYALGHVQRFLNGRPERLEALFRHYPNLATWAVAYCLSEDYGYSGQEVYPHITVALGVPLDTQRRRKLLFECFCRACDRFGLSSRGFNRGVDVYLLHAGVSRPQLPLLINAFLKQEAAFGPPPVETTALLNRWEDDALEYLPPAIHVLRRAILWDETAWHAALFSRIRKDSEGFAPTTAFEADFGKVLAKQPKEMPTGITRAGSGMTIPRPQFCWQPAGLVLRLPRSEGRLRFWLDDAERPLRLRAGEDWPLPQPWPREIRWDAGERGAQTALTLLAGGGCAVFDRVTGHHLRDIGDISGEVDLDASDIVVLARKSFSLAGEAAFEAAPEACIGFARLGPRPVLLCLGSRCVGLKARPRRRLSLTGGDIAGGPRGTLHGSDARLHIETGLYRQERRMLRATLDGQSRDLPVEISAEGTGEVALDQLLARFAGADVADPLRLRIELMAPDADGHAASRSGVALSAWVWPGYRGADHTLFRSVQPVGNLIEAECLHAGRDDQGYLCLDPDGGYAAARAVFAIDGDHVPFDLPWPGVAVTRRHADGSLTPIRLGTRLSVTEDHRFDTISIRCPERKAQLMIRGRCEERSFVGGLPRNLAIRDLLTPAADNRVLLQRANGTEIMLFELVAALAPRTIDIMQGQGIIRLQLQFDEPIDAVAVEIEDEAGTVILAEAALRYRPVATRQPDWLQARISPADVSKVELTLHTAGPDRTPCLARLLIRPEGRDGWRPLRNRRGDSIAVVLAKPTACDTVPDAELSWRFEALCRWLSACYTAECWPVLEGLLVPRWRELGRRLYNLRDGAGLVMRAAALPPPDDAAPGWVPILHPVQILPDLYAAAPHNFATLASSDDPGVSEMAFLARLDTARLRDVLHPTACLACRNAFAADRMGARLEGFEPARFFSHLSMPEIDIDRSAGWFWRGRPLLGPDHWRAAHLRLAERFEAAGLFVEEPAGDGPNSRRQGTLQRLMYAAWISAPQNLRPPAPHRHPQAEEPHAADLWATALLSGFARASRLNDTTGYLDDIARQAGMTTTEALTGIALVLRLAPELFAFHLLLWQIAKERP
ncbi:hypothetical protein P7L66_04135 (plasmid) [Tistrella mobilis]|uniref:hypothetical protein n=1 Tax=Tistrella mobilis TaxID=171437 RepID=UPI0035569604